jgi:hypothetical protein
VASPRVEPKLRPTFDTRFHQRLEHPASPARGLAPDVDEDSVRTPSGVLSGTGSAADRLRVEGWLCPANTPRAHLDQGIVD